VLGVESYEGKRSILGFSLILQFESNQGKKKKNKSDRRTTMRPDFSDILYNLYDK